MSNITRLTFYITFNVLLTLTNLGVAAYQMSEARFIVVVVILYFTWYLAKDTYKVWKKRKKLVHNAVSRSSLNI